MPSPKTSQLTEKIHEAAMTSMSLKGSPELASMALQLQEYLTACREMLGTGPFLTEELLKKRLNFLMDDSKLKVDFPSGYRCGIIVIPCTDGGFAWGPVDVAEGHYLRSLIVDGNDMIVNGFSLDTSALFQILPKELQQLTFTIPPYSLADSYTVTPEERTHILKEYELIYREAQKVFDVH